MIYDNCIKYIDKELKRNLIDKEWKQKNFLIYGLDTLEIQKIKSNVRSLKRANERDLADIGRMVYEKFQSGEVSDMDYVTLCEEIEKRDEEIEKQEEEIVKIQGEV